MSRQIDALLFKVVNSHGNERAELAEAHADTLRNQYTIDRALFHVHAYERIVTMLKTALEAVHERRQDEEGDDEDATPDDSTEGDDESAPDGDDS